MDALGRAIYDALVDDTDLDALLARSVLDAALPAIYTTIPVPQRATMPYIVAYMGDVGSYNDDVLNPDDGGYRRVARDVHAYTARPDDGGGDAEPVQTIAERVRRIFHRQRLVLEGDQVNLVMQAIGPIINDGEYAFGRVVTLSCLLAEPIGA